MPMPFALRRPLLLVRDLVVDRDAPDLDGLRRIADPERFLWAILPHAARTFSACIAMLPAASARTAAVGYLYCRILDTYEDMLVDVDARCAALDAFAARFGPRDAAEPPVALPPARALDAGLAHDARDRTHLLLVERCELVDRVHATLPAAARALVRDVVADMAAGMAASARDFASQGEVLADEAQLLRYCRAVLGNPVLFTARLTRLHHRQLGDLSDAEREACLLSGEFIQLANVTRDIEKDLARGVAFHPALRDDLGRVVPRPARDGSLPAATGIEAPTSTDADLTQVVARVRAVRAEMLDLALSRAPAYGTLMTILDGSRISLTRASALLMLLFTDRYYRGCAVRAGRPAWGRRASGVALLADALRGALSRGHARRRTDAVLAGLAGACGRRV